MFHSEACPQMPFDTIYARFIFAIRNDMRFFGSHKMDAKLQNSFARSLGRSFVILAKSVYGPVYLFICDPTFQTKF